MYPANIHAKCPISLENTNGPFLTIGMLQNMSTSCKQHGCCFCVCIFFLPFLSILHIPCFRLFVSFFTKKMPSHIEFILHAFSYSPHPNLTHFNLLLKLKSCFD